MMFRNRIPPEWCALLSAPLERGDFEALGKFVANAYDSETVYPPKDRLFAALQAVTPEKVRVIILGQDPYHGAGQANGLAFSVNPGVKLPPSLRNILKELNSDLGISIPDSGDLSRWAKQGVLLLNAVMTVTAGSAASHAKCGWEKFTDTLIQTLATRYPRLIFVLWGNYAQQKRDLILKCGGEPFLLESVHPSPLSASRGFLGSKPFSKINARLMAWGESPIDWRLDGGERLL